jgi:hypothetical protein
VELGETPAGYLVQALHPKTGETAGGSFADIPGGRFFDIKHAIARAAELKGRRCAMLFFDMHDASDLPVIAEPLFMGLNAEIEVQPAMNLEDLKKGLAAAAS